MPCVCGQKNEVMCIDLQERIFCSTDFLHKKGLYKFYQYFADLSGHLNAKFMKMSQTYKKGSIVL